MCLRIVLTPSEQVLLKLKEYQQYVLQPSIPKPVHDNCVTVNDAIIRVEIVLCRPPNENISQSIKEILPLLPDNEISNLSNEEHSQIMKKVIKLCIFLPNR